MSAFQRLHPPARLDTVTSDPPTLGQAPDPVWCSKAGVQHIDDQEIEIAYHDGFDPGWYWELRARDRLVSTDQLVILGPYPTSAAAWWSARQALA